MGGVYSQTTTLCIAVSLMLLPHLIKRGISGVVLYNMLKVVWELDVKKTHSWFVVADLMVSKLQSDASCMHGS